MKRSALAVIGLFCFLYILPLGVRPLIIPDECRYAEIAREMLETGNWVAPCFDGLRYFEKPVLGYWLNAGAMRIFGLNAFATRFPSAVAAGISALLVFFLVRRFGGWYWTGIFSAAVLLTCVEVLGVGVSSLLDTLFSMFVTGAMVFFFFAFMAESAVRKRFLFALFGASCGLAFLTKGFVGFAVPVIAIVPFLILERRWRDLYRIPWVPMAAAIAVALPWSIMIHLRESDFWNYFFWVEHIKRFFSDHPQHPFPFWFFVPVIVGGAFPWSPLIPASVLGLKETYAKNPLVRFAACWFLFPFLFFSASHGKLGTYILPCFMPLAILISIGLPRYLAAGNGKRKAFTAGVGASVILVGILLSAFGVSQSSLIPRLSFYDPSETWKVLLTCLGLLSWGGMMLAAMGPVEPARRVVLYCAAPLLFLFSAHFTLPDQPGHAKAPGRFLLDQSEKIHPDTVLVSDKALLGAVCWYYKRSDAYLIEEGGELSYGLSYPEAAHRLLTLDGFGKLVKKDGGAGRVVLITESKWYVRNRSLLPKPLSLRIESGFVFALH